MSMLETVENAAASVLNRVLGEDIYDQLKGEHRQLQELLNHAVECDEEERPAVLKQIEEVLVPHARAEEKTLYSVMHERLKSLSQDKESKELTSEAMDLTSEAYEEHHAVDVLMAELKATSPSDEKWIGKMTVIKENLEHHVKEEENELFSKAQELIGSDEAQELLEAYLTEKEHFSETMPAQTQISERRPSTGAQKLV